MTDQLKLFSERLEKDCAPTPIILSSKKLPNYSCPTINDVNGVLTGLGYEVSTEGDARSNKRFIEEDLPHSRWHSRGMYINCMSGMSEVELLILASERRRVEALQIAKALENKVTEKARKYLKKFEHIDEVMKKAKEEIPTLQEKTNLEIQEEKEYKLIG